MKFNQNTEENLVERQDFMRRKPNRMNGSNLEQVIEESEKYEQTEKHVKTKKDVDNKQI